MKNRRDAVLSALDTGRPQEYIPAAFFLHFDPQYHRGRAAVDEGVGVALAVLAAPNGKLLVPQLRVPQLVEGDVGDRDVLLEDGGVAAPLARAMAEHQPVVAESEQGMEQGHGHGSH